MPVPMHTTMHNDVCKSRRCVFHCEVLTSNTCTLGVVPYVTIYHMLYCMWKQVPAVGLMNMTSARCLKYNHVQIIPNAKVKLQVRPDGENQYEIIILSDNPTLALNQKNCPEGYHMSDIFQRENCVRDGRVWYTVCTYCILFNAIPMPMLKEFTVSIVC
jgi:hypothetical protein